MLLNSNKRKFFQQPHVIKKSPKRIHHKGAFAAVKRVFGEVLSGVHASLGGSGYHSHISIS